MISLDNLTISYGGWTLFDGISFMINPKDRIGLVGKNGAGKTTLLRIITGEQQPTEGAVTINGDVNRVGHPTPAVLTILSDGTVAAEEAQSLLLADETMIQEMLKPHLDFKEKTGADFMILECGTQYTIDRKSVV